jgi:FkbM family methyltransferase
MTPHPTLGAVGRALLRVSPAGVRRRVWDRVWWRPFAYTAHTADGLRMRGHTADLIQRFVYYFGQWEPVISDWFRTHLRPGDVMVDVGANVGWYTLLAAKLVGPAGRVIAVEASPTIAAALRANVALNPAVADRVTVHTCAAGAREGSVSLFLNGPENSGKSSIHGEPGMVREADVPMKPLAALLADVDLGRVRAIKIDVEGAEAEVVAGLLPVADRLPCGAAVLVELAETSRPAVPDALAAAGFVCEGVFPNVYRPAPYLARRYDPFVPTSTIPPTGQQDVLFVKR